MIYYALVYSLPYAKSTMYRSMYYALVYAPLYVKEYNVPVYLGQVLSMYLTVQLLVFVQQYCTENQVQ
jgi:hypothetical protein